MSNLVHLNSVPIKGMNCASCALTIEKTLRKAPGVINCEVNFATEKANLLMDDTTTSIDELNKQIAPFGYALKPYSENSKHETHVMEDGVVMTADEHAEHLGLNQTQAEKQAEINQLRRKMQILLPITLLTFLLMLWEIAAANIAGFPMFPIDPEIYMPFSGIVAGLVLIGFGKPFLKGIATFIRYRVANMDTLVGIGTLTAFVYSLFVLLFPQIVENFGLSSHLYFDVTTVVIGFISFGKYLEANSKLRTGEAIQKLLGLTAKTAIVERNGQEIEIPIDQVLIGDIVLVKPGSKVPVDGLIIWGNSAVDESMVTGEPMPVDKTIGDDVIGGTINKHGSFKFQATKIGSNTLLSQIIKLVETAQGSRAPIQKLVDRISAVFVPAVLIISMITLAVWLVVGSQFLGMQSALALGLSSFIGILVIACPCALGLATPTAIIVGVGKGAQNGILIKNAESLQKLHTVNVIVVDKTGTITKGQPEVTDIITTSALDSTEILRILAALEYNSEHPLAAAVKAKAQQENIEVGETDNFQVLEGKGLQATINGVLYYAGNTKLINELGLEIESSKLEQLTTQGKTPVILATDKEVLSIVAIADTIKDSAIKAVTDLHKLGIKVVMLTGDDRRTAEYIAKQVGIDEVVAQVLPADKAEKVQSLQQQGYKVGMAGDGINDAPALAQSDVGIAMGTGTDVAIESADITLLHGDLEKLAKAIHLSRQTMRTIRQNLFWAFIYNIIGIPLAAGLFYPIWGISLNPAFAGLAMAFSSVSVVLNSLRLKLQKI